MPLLHSQVESERGVLNKMIWKRSGSRCSRVRERKRETQKAEHFLIVSANQAAIRLDFHVELYSLFEMQGQQRMRTRLSLPAPPL